MKPSSPSPGSNSARANREQLQQVRDVLLELHRALLALESETRGRDNRPVSPQQLLHLLLESDELAWLRPISSLIAEMDVLLDADHVPSAWAYKDLLQQAVRMFQLEDEAAEFTLKYRESLQQSLEVAGRHGELRGLLRNLGGGPKR
jgi:hypothetical protein